MAELALPDPPLQTACVLLRPWRREDVPAIVTACQDPLIARFIPHVPRPYTEQDALGWLTTHEPARAAGRGVELAVADPSTDAILGAIAAALNQRDASASVGYWLTPTARGHGYATSALGLLCGWLLHALSLGRIALTTDPDNIASQRVAERCGFQQEGRLRSHLLFADTGRRRDSLIWSLLPDEFAASDGD